jgi:hypothetical protein
VSACWSVRSPFTRTAFFGTLNAEILGNFGSSAVRWGYYPGSCRPPPSRDQFHFLLGKALIVLEIAEALDCAPRRHLAR